MIPAKKLAEKMWWGLAVLLACGGDEPSSGGADAGASGQATVSEGVPDRPLAPAEGFARVSNLYKQGDISIYVVSRGGICHGSQVSPEGLADTTFLDLDLPRGWPPPPGTYPIVSSIGSLPDGGVTMGAFAHLIATDATCRHVGSDEEAKARGGSVTIETATDSLTTGRFDLQFEKGELHGTFSVPLCAVTFPSEPAKDCRR